MYGMEGKKTSEKRCINDEQDVFIAYYYLLLLLLVLLLYLCQIVDVKKIKMKQSLEIKMVTSISDAFLVPEGIVSCFYWQHFNTLNGNSRN